MTFVLRVLFFLSGALLGAVIFVFLILGDEPLGFWGGLIALIVGCFWGSMVLKMERCIFGG